MIIEVVDNNLTSLPDEIGNLVNLEELYINGNNITTLPKTIIQISPEDTLDLGNNQLSNLPSEVVEWATLYDPDWQNSQETNIDPLYTTPERQFSGIKVMTNNTGMYISLDLLEKCLINMSLVNLKGQCILKIINGHLHAGSHAITIDTQGLKPGCKLLVVDNNGEIHIAKTILY